MKCLEWGNLYRKKVGEWLSGDGRGWRELQVTADRYGASFGGDGNISDPVVMVTTATVNA
jgi:hypothetical protein